MLAEIQKFNTVLATFELRISESNDQYFSESQVTIDISQALLRLNLKRSQANIVVQLAEPSAGYEKLTLEQAWQAAAPKVSSAQAPASRRLKHCEIYYGSGSTETFGGNKTAR